MASFPQLGNILYETKIRKANWIGYILRKNCLLRNVIDGNTKKRIQVMGGRGGRRKQLLDDLKEKRGNYTLKREALKTALLRVITQRVITLKNAVLSCFAG
jgi:hypothetical protein